MPPLCKILCCSVSPAAFLSDTKDRGPPAQPQTWRSAEKFPFGQTHYLRAFEKPPQVRTQALRDFEKVSHMGGLLLSQGEGLPRESDVLQKYDPRLSPDCGHAYLHGVSFKSVRPDKPLDGELRVECRGVWAVASASAPPSHFYPCCF